MRTLAVFMVALGLGACGSDTSGSDIQPTAESLHSEVFKDSCATSGCHDASASGDLKLTSVSDVKAMVDKSADSTRAAEDDLLLVVAGKPEESYLIDRLENTTYGTKMPQGQAALPADVIAVVKQWITDGAE